MQLFYKNILKNFIDYLGKKTMLWGLKTPRWVREKGGSTLALYVARHGGGITNYYSRLLVPSFFLFHCHQWMTTAIIKRSNTTLKVVDTHFPGLGILACQQSRATRRYRNTRRSAVQRYTWLQWPLPRYSCRRCCTPKGQGGRRNRCGGGIGGWVWQVLCKIERR